MTDVRPRPSSGRLAWLAGAMAGSLAYLFGYQSRAWTTDADSAVQGAWQLVHHGTFRVPDNQLANTEFTQTAHGLYSNRPLGMILASAPGQLFSNEPSELGAAVVAAVLCAAIAFLMVRMFGRVGLVAVFGAPLLYVAGRTLWPETVGLLGLVVVMWLARRAPTDRRALVGIALVVAGITLCRVPLGLLLVPLASVWADGDDARRWWRSRVMASAALGFGIGLAVLLVYARWTFASWSPNPGYPVSHTLQLSQVAVGLFSPARGLLVWSPFVLAARLTRRSVVSVAWAGAYTVASWLLFNAWGGDGFTGYRYALPLAFVVAPFVSTDTMWRRAFIAWSVGLGITTTTLSWRPIARDRIWTQTGMPVLVYAYAVVLSVVLFAAWEYILRRKPDVARVDVTSAGWTSPATASA